MPDPTPSPDDIRATARALEARAKADPAFAQQVKADPAGTLRAAGIPPLHAQAIVDASPLGGEVAGYLNCDQTCYPNAQAPSCFFTDTIGGF